MGYEIRNGKREWIVRNEADLTAIIEHRVETNPDLDGPDGSDEVSSEWTCDSCHSPNPIENRGPCDTCGYCKHEALLGCGECKEVGCEYRN